MPDDKDPVVKPIESTNPSPKPGSTTPPRADNGTPTPMPTPSLTPTVTQSPLHPDQVHGLTPPTVSPPHPDQVHGLTPPDQTYLSPIAQTLPNANQYNVQGSPEQVEKLQDGLAVLSTLDNPDAQEMLEQFQARGTYIHFGEVPDGAGAVHRPVNLLQGGADEIILNNNLQDASPDVIAANIAMEGIHGLQYNENPAVRLLQADGLVAGNAIHGDSWRATNDMEVEMFERGVPIYREIQNKYGARDENLDRWNVVAASGDEALRQAVIDTYGSDHTDT